VHSFSRMSFDRLNPLALELGVLKANGTQTVGSPQTFGTAEVQDTYNLLRSSLRKLLVRVLGPEPPLGEQFIREQSVEQYTNDQ